MIAIRDLPRLESSDGPTVRLIYTRNATKPLLFCPQICHFMRLALLNWGARRAFFVRLLSFIAGPRKETKNQRCLSSAKETKDFLKLSVSLEKERQDCAYCLRTRQITNNKYFPSVIFLIFQVVAHHCT